jgi:hypothetical protein
MVALGGDNDNVVYRHRGRPILFPELEVLQSLHGYDAVTEVHVVGVCDMSQDEALERLRLIYGMEHVAKVYHGPRPRLPLADSTLPLCKLKVHIPKPTLPESPDPQLRPLGQFIGPARTAEVAPFVHPVGEDDSAEGPSPYDLAEHEQDAERGEDDPGNGDKEDDGGLADLVTRPVVQDMPLTRPGFRGGAREARRTPDHLPDVMDMQERPRRSEEHDHVRARG